VLAAGGGGHGPSSAGVDDGEPHALTEASRVAAVEPRGPEHCASPTLLLKTRPSIRLGPDGARRRRHRRRQQRARRAAWARTVRVVVATATDDDTPVEPRGP